MIRTQVWSRSSWRRSQSTLASVMAVLFPVDIMHHWLGLGDGVDRVLTVPLVLLDSINHQRIVNDILLLPVGVDLNATFVVRSRDEADLGAATALLRILGEIHEHHKLASILAIPPRPGSWPQPPLYVRRPSPPAAPSTPTTVLIHVVDCWPVRLPPDGEGQAGAAPAPRWDGDGCGGAALGREADRRQWQARTQAGVPRLRFDPRPPTARGRRVDPGRGQRGGEAPSVSNEQGRWGGAAPAASEEWGAGRGAWRSESGERTQSGEREKAEGRFPCGTHSQLSGALGCLQQSSPKYETHLQV